MASGNAPDDPLVVPELLEAILLKLPQRDILLAQRVSKTWLATITSSLALQQALSFQPALPKEGYILAQGAIKSLGFTTRHRDESRPMTSLEIQCNNEAPFRWWIVKCVPVVLSDVPPANLHRFQSHSAIKTRTALKASLNTLVAEGLSERMTSYATNLDGRANEYGEELLLFDADEKGRAMNWGSSVSQTDRSRPAQCQIDLLTLLPLRSSVCECSSHSHRTRRSTRYSAASATLIRSKCREQRESGLETSMQRSTVITVLSHSDL